VTNNGRFFSRASTIAPARFVRHVTVKLADPVPMTVETVFDLASVTKVMATTMAVMLLVDRGALELDAPVDRYLPDFRGGGRDDITIAHLLTHRSGMPQWLPIYYHAAQPSEAYDYIRRLPLSWPVGTERHYSDLGFMVLGIVVEAVTGRTLDAFLQAELYRPLGLDHTGFASRNGGARPVGPHAATSHGNPYENRMVHDPDFGYAIDGDPTRWSGWRRYTLSGEVNDGNAHHAFQGMAGHAGLFSTAGELGVLLRLLLEGGTAEGRRYIDESTVERFLTDTGDGQALGWQLPGFAPSGSFSHTGFTGTFVLGDRTSGLALVLLTNRQNGGVDGTTQYPDVGPLQRAVTAAFTGAR
jgi:CubicO group peptidase (beta-lactamase class C family)